MALINDLIYWIGYGKDKQEADAGDLIIDQINDEVYLGYVHDDNIEIFTDASTERENPGILASWFNRRSRIVNLADSIN